MPDPGRDRHCAPAAPGTPDPAGQRNGAMTAVPDDHRLRIGQFPARELDLYGNQLARCLQALGTNAPIRADIQRELATVLAEQASRASASEPGRLPKVGGLTAADLNRTRRELAASLALARPGSPMRGPILAHLGAIDTELARRTAGQPGQLPGSRVPDPLTDSGHAAKDHAPAPSSAGASPCPARRA
jgi:hypothetical protein